MNFLVLVQELWRESGSGGRMPATVTGQAGEALRLVNWIRQADLYIQTLYTDWNFLWAQGSFTTEAGTFLYTPAEPVGRFDRDAWRVDGELVCAHEYIDVKGIAREQSTGAPYQVVMMPNKSIRLDVTPDNEYLVEYDYWAPATPMPFDSVAESVIPAGFRYAIVGKALMDYARYENAPEVMTQGETMFNQWVVALSADQLPGKRHYHTTAEGSEWSVEVE
jgi:hypothetical protein